MSSITTIKRAMRYMDTSLDKEKSCQDCRFASKTNGEARFCKNKLFFTRPQAGCERFEKGGCLER